MLLGVAGWVEATCTVGDEPNAAYMELVDRASKWAQKGEYENAIVQLDNFIRVYKSEEGAFNLRGSVWARRHDHVKAIADFTEAIRLDPTYEAAFINRALSFQAAGDQERAVGDATEAIRLNSKNPRLNSKNPRAFFVRGCSRVLQRSYKQAIADYDVAIGFDPMFVEAYTNRGDAWRKLKHYDKAMADFNEAIRIDPYHMTAYLYRGRTLSDRKAFSKALADYQEALRLDPKDGRTLQALAWLWATCPDAAYRDGDRAVDAATRASDMVGGKSPFALAVLAAAHAERGDFEEAVKCQEKAMDMLKIDESKAHNQECLRCYKAKSPYRDER